MATCSAVKATIEGKTAPGQIDVLFRHIQPLAHESNANADGIKANAKFQRDLLMRTSTVILGLVQEKELTVAAGYYEIVTGNVTLLGT